MKETEKGGRSSRELVRLCADGDTEARSRFVQELRPVVQRAVGAVLATRGQACTERIEDISQDIFLSLFRDDCSKLRQYQGRNGCSLAGWLRVVAARATIDSLRKQRREASGGVTGDPLPALADTTSAPSNAPEQQLAARQALRKLLSAVEALGGEDRCLIELHFSRGLSMEQIAPVLGTTTNALYIRKSRLLQRLRKVTAFEDVT